jgi:hypothetical protein
MESEARAALREKVARALYEAEGGTKWDILGEGKKDDYRYLADAAIDVALEEAAAICDAYAEKDWARGEGFRNRAALDLTAAIRGLIR